MIFKDRSEAGRILADRLLIYKKENPVILALPRGGVVVGFEIAKRLQVPLDVFIVRKIGSPENPEFAVGAIAEGGVRLLDEQTVGSLGITPNELEKVVTDEERELKRRVDEYREGREITNVRGRTVILVDDGLATGMTSRAAIEGIKKFNPQKIIFVLPVCAYDTVEKLRTMVDELLCLTSPLEFGAVGLWYENFAQISDNVVKELLQKANQLIKEKGIQKYSDGFYQ